MRRAWFSPWEHRFLRSPFGTATVDCPIYARCLCLSRRCTRARRPRGRLVIGIRARRHRPVSTPRRHWRARALAWTAIRETWEETGILVGKEGSFEPRRSNPATAAFQNAGLVPAPGHLDYIVRAVTPTHSPIRFDTRFSWAMVKKPEDSSSRRPNWKKSDGIRLTIP